MREGEENFAASNEAEDLAQDVAAAANSTLAEAIAFQEAAGQTDRRRRRGQARGAAPPEAEPGEARTFLAKQSRMLDIQMEHLHEQRLLVLSHLRLRRANEALRVTFQALTIAIGVAAVAIVAILAIQAHNAQALIIEPFRVPPMLAQRGVDGTVLASRLLDKLREIQNATDSARAAGTFTKDFGDDIKLEIPQTGVSIGELERYLRQWLGHDTHISGELFQSFEAAGAGTPPNAGPSRLSLTVRAGADPGDTVEGSPIDLDAMIQKSAEALFLRTQPYRYTVYLARHGRLEEADRLLATLVATGSPQERAWAFEHWGVVSVLRDGDVAKAEKKEREALRLDPDLVMAHDNLAGDEILLGHDGSAETQLKAEYKVLKSHRADQLTPAVRPVLSAWSHARLDEGLGDFRGAARDIHPAQDLADYRGSSHAAFLNEAATLALAHDVSASRALLASADRPTDASSFQESFGWGSNLLPEISQDVALDDWAAMIDDLKSARAGPSFILGPTAMRTYVEPWLAWSTAMSGDHAGAAALIAATPTDCYLCLRIRGKLAAAAGDWAGAAGW
ncbi:MAG: hypothetical protein M3T55_08400, partial [Pseudomonadota bacterium]|nr:hypothetical protein [Pseudomonadota bacterium]